MLMDKGKHGGMRMLSRPSVELMTTDQLTPEQTSLCLRVGLGGNPKQPVQDPSQQLSEGLPLFRAQV